MRELDGDRWRVGCDGCTRSFGSLPVVGDQAMAFDTPPGWRSVFTLESIEREGAFVVGIDDTTDLCPKCKHERRTD